MAKKDVISPEAQKGFMGFTPTGTEKSKLFKRKSKGAEEREARRYLQRRQGNVELVYPKEKT